MFGFLKRLLRSGSRRIGRDHRALLYLEHLEERLNPSPTAQQEYMLELVNRMRTNPSAELSLLLNANDPNVNQNLSYFNVNQQVLAQQWASLTPVAPLAWSDALAQSATGHSNLMLQDDQQAHQLSGEADPGTRMANAGFAPVNTFSWGENIFAYSQSVFEGHAAFAIDWGSTSTGIQDPAGHRENIMDPDFTQVGIGLVSGQGQQVGPLLITQDFAGPSYLAGASNPYLVGAVFNDANGDGFSNPGEGLGGVPITVTDGSGNFVTTTTGSAGDYQLQLPAGTYSVTASGGALGSTTEGPQSVTIGSSNVLLNFGGASSTTTALTIPTVTGPAGTVPSSTPTISWTTSTGADHYELMLNDTTTGKTALLDQQNVTTNSFSVTTALLAAHKYTALVRAFDASGNATAWSKPFPFTVVLPAAPSLTGPTGSLYTAFPTFSWTSVTGADHYGLNVYDATTGTNQVIWQQNLTGTSYTPTTPLLAGHQYMAWVRAFNAAGQNGNGSNGITFTIASPPAPTVTGPTGSSTNLYPTITWTTSKGASSYGLSVYDATTGTNHVIWQQNLTGNSFTPTTPLTAGHQYWAAVRAFNDAGQAGSWSTVLVFTIAKPPAPAVPTVTGPTGSVTTLTPTFTWTAVSGVDHYDLWVVDNTAGGTQVIRQLTLTTTSYTPTTALVHGHHYAVRVRSFDGLGQTRGWSQALLFIVL